MTSALTPSVGDPLGRVEGREKVTGQARYAFEYLAERLAYAVPVQASIAAGRVAAVDVASVLAEPSVLAVISNENAPRLGQPDDGELALFQSPTVSYRGQIVAAVVAESLEVAVDAAARCQVAYVPRPHDVALRADHPRLYRPEHVNPGVETDSEQGDVELALAGAATRVDATYETPAFHNHPMEPHASMARWDDEGLTVYESTQAPFQTAEVLAEIFGLPHERVRVIASHVGGGFGSKGTPRPQVVLAAMAAQMTGRPVKVALTRQQMAALTGYRTPTIQTVRLGANDDGHLEAIAHDVIEQTSTVREFAEQTALATRVMYAAPHRRTRHRLVRLDVPSPSWMRAPGECPGMYALESAMDELAVACRLDPIELRERNEPDADPETGLPFSSRHLVECLREGAARFGWTPRDPSPGIRRDGRWLVGTGVAASTYPARRRPSTALARTEPDGTFTVALAAVDIGTGARTALTQIAADALGVGTDRVRLLLGDSSLPPAPLAGGSMGTASWGSAVVRACEDLRRQLGAGAKVAGGIEVRVDTTEEVASDEGWARHGFGAQFAEARVNVDTGEVKVARLLGVFAVGSVINTKTARSQLIGGMTMGLSMALHEHSVLDGEFGDFLTRDLATYHVATCADVGSIEAAWIDEPDDRLNPMGAKGIGEIGIVGTAAAVGNAVYHACGVRIRRLPIQPDRLVGLLH